MLILIISMTAKNGDGKSCQLNHVAADQDYSESVFKNAAVILVIPSI
jgi:hypothetical protein